MKHEFLFQSNISVIFVHFHPYHPVSMSQTGSAAAFGPRYIRSCASKRRSVMSSPRKAEPAAMTATIGVLLS